MKYLIYARKSTDEDDRQILSIEAQLTELKEFASKEGLEIADEFIEAKTAKVPGRPIFNQMIARIEADGPFGILSWHPDRLARNSVDGGKIIYLVDTGKIGGLKFPTFWFDATPQGKFMLNIAFGQSKYYIDNLSENVKRGLRQKLRKGDYPAFAPIGYLNELRHHTIIKDPQRAEIVRKIFQLYSSGKYTFEDLHELSFAMGLAGQRKGKAITLSKIQTLLKNPFYYGLFRFKGELYQGNHEPIISKQLFEKVQRVMQERGKPQKKSLKSYTFKGVFKCGECGRQITAETKIKPSGKTYTYYRCTKKNRVCAQKYISEQNLTQQLNKLFQKVALSVELKNYFLNRWEKDFKDFSTNANASAQNLKAELKIIEAKLNRLLDIYVDQAINREEYAAKKQKLLNRRVEINEEVENFGRKGNVRLGLFKEWILQAFQANSIAESENLEEKRSLLKKIGSDFRITGQKPLISLQNPWSLSAKKAEFISMSG
ncbi:MAG TPA: recombinase family protein [Candidatus Paceibacterota bacterium]|nr:recombinase family protein [Candidatus Pacearchaeota archaeon]HRZ50644.1 recombinase family protein [Candidatus Paceibacterota bacterium]HSA36459.1 recombinase family protein [Candidatus Paceibacterota bacterium]